MSVYLFCLTVSPQQSSQHPLTSHPQDLDWHTGVSCTLPLTSTCVTPFPAGNHVLTDTCPGVNRDWLSDNQTILDQFTHILPCNIKMYQGMNVFEAK